MSDWEHRLTQESSPAHVVERQLRYGLAAPLIRDAELWVDLGCGNGGAAANALDAPPAASLLVDIDDDALARAAVEFRGAQTLHADVAAVEGIAAVRDAIGAREAVITCFGTLAHLIDFTPCVELLLDLRDDCTVVLSVPNDAFWPTAPGAHRTRWGAGAVEELRRLLPADHVALDQVPLAASAIVADGAGELALAPARIPPDRVPSHYVLAFGPKAAELRPLAATGTVDSCEERRLDRERDAELAILAARIAELEQAR
jgi:SAM-dependent methyltransferase